MTEAGSAEGQGSDLLPGLVAQSASAQELARLAARAARRATTVLLSGESGAGKGHVARAIHDMARGASAPWAVIDCASLPEGLAENELFGHEAGAYSGAEGRRAGRFETAHGGSILLDRVSDLPLAVQGKLLRVLQERCFERVGGQVTVRVDVLVIATTSCDLRQLVAEGAFREDLLYRLDVIHLRVPALRDRKEDILPLAAAFVDRCSTALGRPLRLGGGAIAALESHAWPGNVRELANVIERAALATNGSELDREDIAAALATPTADPRRATAELAALRLPLRDVERHYIERVLELTGHRIGEAAELLGIHRKTLLEKRKRYGLD